MPVLDNFLRDNTLKLETPWFLLLLPIVIMAMIWAYRLRPATLQVSTVRHYAQALRSKSRYWAPTKIPRMMEGIGLMCLVIALARPQRGVEETIRRTEGIDIMLALDISGSMQALDVPSTITDENHVVRMIRDGEIRPRIDVAQDEVKRFIDKRPNDRLGMVAFSGNTYTVCPPTLDHEFLKGHLERLKAGMLGDGTGIAAPIANATSRLKESKAKRRVLVLFTDGENNVEAKISPLEAAKIAKMFDVITYTVGIGSDRAYMIRPGFFGRQQLFPINNYANFQLLKDIAGETNGKFFSAEDAEGLKRTISEIDQLEKTNIEQPTYIDYRDLYKIWLQSGIVLCLLGFLLEQTLFLKIP